MCRNVKTIFLSYCLLAALITSLLPAAVQAAPAQQEFPPPERPVHNGIDSVKVDIGASTNQVLEASYSFPDPHLWWTTEIDSAGGKEEEVPYIQMAIPGMEQAYGELGKPAIPFYSRLLALPQGASVEVTGFEVTTGETVEGKLYPVQEEAMDSVLQQEGEEEFDVEEYTDPPFTINDEFYAGDFVYPESPVLVEVLGEMGSLRLARVSVATAQYSTAKQTLTFFKGVNFKLTYKEGKEYFLTERDMIPFNQPDEGVVGLLLNPGAVKEFILRDAKLRFVCLGQEYLIITDPAFRAAADTLAAAKRAAGISTAVAETGTGAGKAGTTRTAIKNFIRDRYNQDCTVQLKYVLLLGDAEFIPVWYNRTYGGDTPGSDLEYTLMTGTDIVPDLYLGRIPVDTLLQANTVVNKIVAYEQTPPTQASFYEDVTVAGYFQCCRPRVYEWGNIFNPVRRVDGVTSRSFIETAELIQSELDSEGYSVERIYTTSNAYHNSPTATVSISPQITVTVPDPDYYNPSTRDLTPRRYYNQASLPSAIGPNNFGWNGSRQDVRDAINNGTFLLIHRDHGFKDGWGDPSFTTTDISFLNNGNLTPVVYSINCASGLFDNETLDPNLNRYNYRTQPTRTYWAESFLRQSDGAVAVIGDTRNSPTWANSAFARGLVDATWPGTVPEGGNTRTRRMGKILNYAKVYLLGQVGVAQTAGSVTNAKANGDVLMYHLFGDPTMKMWRQNPNQNQQPTGYTFSAAGPNQWIINHVQNGATITAMQGNTALARGTVENGAATLQFWADRPADAPIDFVLSYDDSVAVTLPLQQLTLKLGNGEAGNLTSPDKQLKIDIPPAAVTGETEFILTGLQEPSHLIPKEHDALRSFQLHASDGENFLLDFKEPLNVEICVDAEEQKNLKAAFIARYNTEDGLWTALKSEVDTKSGCVSAPADHLSEFALLRNNSLSFGDDQGTIYLPLIKR